MYCFVSSVMHYGLENFCLSCSGYNCDFVCYFLL